MRARAAHRGCTSRTGLAARTEVTAAAGDDDAADQGATAAAGLARPLVNTESSEKIAGAPFDIDVITETRPLKIDRVAEDLSDRTMQSPRSLARKPPGLS